jgi:LemA protein
MSRRVVIVIAASAIVIVLACWIARSIFYLSAAKDSVDTEWAGLEYAYHQRADMMPGLLGTTRDVARYDAKDWDALRDALAQLNTFVDPPNREAIDDPKLFGRYEDDQRRLTIAVYGLIAVVDRDPVLRYDQGYEDMKKELAVTSSRIEVSKQRYDDDARAFDEVRKTFPDPILAKMLGGAYVEKSVFHDSSAGPQGPPAAAQDEPAG